MSIARATTRFTITARRRRDVVVGLFREEEKKGKKRDYAHACMNDDMCRVHARLREWAREDDVVVEYDVVCATCVSNTRGTRTRSSVFLRA